jgi:hypothetical protein
MLVCTEKVLITLYITVAQKPVLLYFIYVTYTWESEYNYVEQEAMKYC